MNEYKFQLPELKFEMPIAQNTLGVPQLNPGNFNPPNIPYKWKNSWEQKKTDLERNYVANKDYKLNTPQSTPVKQQSSLGNQAAAAGIQALSSNIADKMTDGMFGDSYIGQNLANIFSQGVSTAGNTMATNIMKGQALTQGLGQNVGQSIKGAALGLGANLVGQGINSIGGDSRLSRGIGQGVATGIVNAPGIINGIKTLSATGKAIKETQSALSAAKTAGDIAKNQTMLTNLNAFKGAQLTNLAGIGASVLGTALGAATGPSKEYGGKYGKITQTADMIYDLGTAAVGFMGPVGLGVSGIMAMNKGLSNLFGSTDGMTVQDAILGSAFMPAPVKWLNMAGATTTGTFNNQSWQNQQKADSFMGNAFGNLGDKFAKARDEAGKTYGTFSSGAAHEAQDNINFANSAWNKILAMADQNELQNIRSQYMTSINNQRYAQQIGGAYQPISRGRYGMKILNNATNHNIGMRLLSGAALIDNKQMILSAQGGTKVTRPPRMRAHRKGDESKGLTPEEQEWWKQHEEEQKRQQEEENARKQKQQEEAADKFNKQISTVIGAMTQQANETPFTGQEYQQAVEDQRQKKVEKFHEAEKIGEATLMADLAVSAVPLLQRGFRWVFNKAGQLIKVPLQKTVQETSSIIKPTIRKEYVTSPKDITSDVGDLIAEGSERSVYASKSNPNIVYKIEDGNAPLEDINNIKIRSEINDDIIAPETTVGYYKHKNGKYYRVTQQDKYKSYDPDNFYEEVSPELNQEIIKTLEKAGWKVNIKNGHATTASKNGVTIGNLEHFNWGRDSEGNLKLIDQYVANDSKLQASLESDFKGKPVILSVPKTMRKADSDVAKMNEYHAANVQEYNQSTGNNVTSIPFRTDYNGRQVKVLPNKEFNTIVQSKNTNAPSGNEQNVGGMYSKNDDTVYLRNTGNPSNNYHEFLHSSRYGETNPEVTQWRIQQLIDEDKVSKMTPQQKAYYISINETPVHLRQQGERMNIKVGDPYPGDEAFDKMINEHGIGGATYYMKRDTSKAKQLLWKAFNGTLFSGLTAATLYNINK